MRYYTTKTQLPPYIPYARFLLKYPLSETARLVYSLILHRITLSQANSWMDADSRVYCRYPIKSLVEDSGKSKTTVLNALNELESQGLLTRHRAGAGYANRLYLRLPENGTSDDRVSVPQRSGKRYPNKYTNNITNKQLNYTYTGDSL